MGTWLIVLGVVALAGTGLFIWSWWGQRAELALIQARQTNSAADARTAELTKWSKWMLGFATLSFVLSTLALFWAYAVTGSNNASVAPPVDVSPAAPSPQ